MDNFPVFRSLYKPDDSIPETYLFSHRKEYVEHLQSLGYKRRVRWVFAKTVNTDFQCSIELTCYRAPEIAPFSFKAGISSLKVWNLLGEVMPWPAVAKPSKMGALLDFTPNTPAAHKLSIGLPHDFSFPAYADQHHDYLLGDTDATLAYVEAHSSDLGFVEIARLLVESVSFDSRLLVLALAEFVVGEYETAHSTLRKLREQAPYYQNRYPTLDAWERSWSK